MGRVTRKMSTFAKRPGRVGLCLALGFATVAVLAGAQVAGASPSTYTYTGGEQAYVVPPGVTEIAISAVGAPGGAGPANLGSVAVDDAYPGGNGASVSATVTVTPGQTLYVEVGGPGASSGCAQSTGPAPESFNGGTGASCGGAGGGASDVRTCSMSSCDLLSSDTRLVVAGGGGGGAASVLGCGGTDGGQAGDTTVTGAGNGGRGDPSCSVPGAPGGNGGFGSPGGTKGSLDAGGFGDGFLGGGGGPQVPGGMGGGAGGGYFGGGFGDNNDQAGGGGGAGSSYWVPSATATSMSEDASGTPSVTITPILPAAPCDPGSYSATGNAPCTPAPAGSYDAGTGNTAATPCPPGTFSDSLGASACTPASPGFYASGTGNTSATQCAPGTYSTAAGASSCTPADKGSYATGPGATSESPCPAGTFSAVTGSASCTPAPIGSYDAGTGNTSATPCPSGTTTTVVGATACVAITQAPTFVLASPSLTATVGQLYGYTFLASGVPTPTYSLKTGAPSWLSVDANGGTLTGTPPTGTKSFTYTVIASNGVTPNATATFTVTVAKAPVQADLSVSLSSCPTSLKVGTTGSCTITVHNSGPAPATSAIVGVALPSNLARVSASTGGAWWFNIVSWKITSLASGASQSFTVTFKALSTGTAKIAAATVSFNPDPNWRNDFALAAVTLTRS